MPHSHFFNHALIFRITVLSIFDASLGLLKASLKRKEIPDYTADGTHHLEGTDSCHWTIWNEYISYLF